MVTLSNHTDFFKLTKLENQIVYLSEFKQSTIDIVLGKKIIEILKLASRGEKLYVIIDLKRIKHIEKNARDFLASSEVTGNFNALGFLSHSLIHEFNFLFFKNFSKPSIPVKLFKDQTKAKEWLENIIKNDD